MYIETRLAQRYSRRPNPSTITGEPYHVVATPDEAWFEILLDIGLVELVESEGSEDAETPEETHEGSEDVLEDSEAPEVSEAPENSEDALEASEAPENSEG